GDKQNGPVGGKNPQPLANGGAPRGAAGNGHARPRRPPRAGFFGGPAETARPPPPHPPFGEASAPRPPLPLAPPPRRRPRLRRRDHFGKRAEFREQRLGERLDVAARQRAKQQQLRQLIVRQSLGSGIAETAAQASAMPVKMRRGVG